MDGWRSPALPEALRTVPAGDSIRPVDPPPTSAVDPTPDVIVGEAIAEGGMGVIHAATQPTLGRSVAVKRVRPDAPPSARRRLIHEASIAARLAHPHVPPIHDLQVDSDGRPSVIMQRIAGDALLALLDDPEHPGWPTDGDRRLPFVVETLVAVCRALSAAHAQGIIHRDVKPANIMLGPFGEVFLVDWGLAVSVDAPAGSGLVGTPAYMAPEMLEQRAVGPFTDVYLVGATLFHGLTGHPFHAGDRFIDVVRHIVEGPDLTFDDAVPAALQAVCRRATRADPDGRYGTVDALRVALQDALRYQTSVELASSAHGRIPQITSVEASERQRRRAYDEARFALMEARRRWPDNPEVPRCADAARAAMVALELDAGNLVAARHLLAEAPGAHPTLDARLGALVRAQEAASARATALESFARGHDANIGSRSRTLGLAAFALAAVIVTIGMFVVRIDVGYPQMLAIHAATFAMSGPILAAVWLRSEHNLRSRQLLASVAIMSAFVLACTAMGWQLDLPIVALLLVESLALAPGYLLVGIALDRRAAAGAPVVLAGVAFGLVVPEHAPLGVAAAHAGALAAAAAALIAVPVGTITRS